MSSGSPPVPNTELSLEPLPRKAAAGAWHGLSALISAEGCPLLFPEQPSPSEIQRVSGREWMQRRIEYLGEGSVGSWEVQKDHWVESGDLGAWAWPCSCVTLRVTSPAGTSLEHEKAPLNLLEAKIAAAGLPVCRSPGTRKPKKSPLLVGGRKFPWRPQSMGAFAQLCVRLRTLHR